AREHDVVLADRVRIEAEVAPQVLPPPVLPHPAVGHLRDQPSLRLGYVTAERRRAPVLGERQAPLGVVELVAHRRFAELVKPFEASETVDRLEGAVEQVALELQLLFGELATAERRGGRRRLSVAVGGELLVAADR